jgi:thioester reductase-like protein
MAYFLLTGATGLLGRYLLRDLTVAELPLAVVVRPTKWESAVQRIETALAHWENELHRTLVRPVVLVGDIAEPCLGLSDRDLRWVRDHCRSMIHSAASLTFHAEQPDGEPWRSNVQGTRNVLDLCLRAGIRQYHHVSTAYVCGLRRGRILETELDVGQQLGNDYEQSKLTAEKEVLAAPALEQITVYRPSIIVGDSQTGFTTSYHGFYTPLRIVYSLLQTVPWETILRGDWLGRLQLAGDEHKNLVSVEWVSAAMAQLIARRACHGQTYHLTNPAPVTALSIQDAIARGLAEVVLGKQPKRATSAAAEDFVASFREQMAVYRSYWSDDPQFDSTHTQAAVPQLPCPQINPEVMDRLIRFAIQSNFGWPREAPIVPPNDVAQSFDGWLDDDRDGSSGNGPLRYVNLRVSGRGGGQWCLVVERERLVQAEIGWRDVAGTACSLTSTTFAQLTHGDLTWEDAIYSGRVVIAGRSVHPYELARLFRDLVSDNETRTFQKAMIG